MKKYFTFFTVVLLINIVGILSPTYGQWQKHIIDNSFRGTILSIADIDGDNDMDVVVTSEPSDRLVWYENNLPDTNWTKHTIDANLPGGFCVNAADIDGDGTMDVVASGYRANAIYWYENNHPTWNKNLVAGFNSGGYMNVFDMNDDNTLDVVSGGYNVGNIAWFENNYPAPWVNHPIRSTWGNGAKSLQVGDIDGDDTLDVAVVGSATDKVTWFRGLSWPEYTIDDSLDGAWHLYIEDIDGDDNMDVVATGMNADDVVWYENNLPDTNWTKHTIDANLDGARCVAVAYIDGDEKLDVVATGKTSNGKVVWYKNNHPDWEKIIIDNLYYPNHILTVDMDGDNDFDVIVAGDESPGHVVWYENLIITSVEDENQLPTVFSLEQNYPNPFNPTTTINYQIPDLSFVTLKVYDVLGSEVAILVNEEKTAGNYEVDFDGEYLVSGIYFYKLQAGDFVSTKKMILMK